MVEDKSFELLTKMYSEMKEQFAVVNGRIDTLQSEVNGRIDTLQSEVDGRIDTLQSEVNGRFDTLQSEVDGRIDTLQSEVNGRIDTLQSEVKTIGNQIVKLENDLKPKIEAALDGYKQNTDILERIEKEVTRQDEIIMRRIK